MKGFLYLNHEPCVRGGYSPSYTQLYALLVTFSLSYPKQKVNMFGKVFNWGLINDPAKYRLKEYY